MKARKRSSAKPSCARRTPGYDYEIYDASKSLLTRYKALCEEKGSQLIVMLFPNLTAHALAEPASCPMAKA